MEELIKEESGKQSKDIVRAYTAANGSYSVLKKWYRKSPYAKNDEFLEKVLHRKTDRQVCMSHKLAEDMIVLDLLASHSKSGRKAAREYYDHEICSKDDDILDYLPIGCGGEGEASEDFIKTLKKMAGSSQGRRLDSFLWLYGRAFMPRSYCYQIRRDWLFKEMLERPIDMLDLIADLKLSAQELFGEQMFILMYTILKWQQEGLRSRCLKHLENIVAKSSKELKDDDGEVFINISYLLSIDDLQELLGEFRAVLTKLAEPSKRPFPTRKSFSFESFPKTVKLAFPKPDERVVLLQKLFAEVVLADDSTANWISSPVTSLVESLRSSDKDYQEWIPDDILEPLVMKAISKGCLRLSKRQAPDSKSFLELFLSSFYGHPHLYIRGSALTTANLLEKLAEADPNRKGTHRAEFRDHRNLVLMKMLSSSLHDVLSVPLIPLQIRPRALVLGLNHSIRKKALNSFISEHENHLTSDGRISLGSLQSEFSVNFVTIDTNNFQSMSNYELPIRHFKDYPRLGSYLEYARGKYCFTCSSFPASDQNKIVKATGYGYKFIVEPKRGSGRVPERVSLLYWQKPSPRSSSEVLSLKLYSGETSNVYRKPYLSVELRDNEWMILNPVSKKVILRINLNRTKSKSILTNHPLLSRLKVTKASRYSSNIIEVNVSDRTLRKDRTTRLGRTVKPSDQDFDFIVREHKRGEENAILDRVKEPIRRILSESTSLIYYNEHCELYKMSSQFVFGLTYRKYKMLDGINSTMKKFVVQEKCKLYWIDIFDLKAVNKPKIGKLPEGKQVQVLPAEMGQDILPPHFLSHYDPTDFQWSFEPRTSNLICMIKITKWKVTTANACGHLIFTAHINHPLLTEEGYASQERDIARWKKLKPVFERPVVLEEC